MVFKFFIFGIKPVGHNFPMNKTIEFLDSLQRRELAFYHRYQLPKYTLATQQVINTYFEKIGLSEAEINSLITNFNLRSSQDGQCPRCGSFKNRLESRTRDHSSYGGILNLIPIATGHRGNLDEEKIRICNVCSLWINQTQRIKNESKWEKILNFFSLDWL